MRAKTPILFATLLLASCSEAGREMAAENTSNVAQDITSLPVADSRARGQDETTFCDVVDQRTTVDDCEDLKALQEQVRISQAAVNISPDPLLRGHPATVTLFIDRRPLELLQRIEAEREAGTDQPAVDVFTNDADAVDAAALDNAAAAADAASGNATDLQPATPADEPAPTPGERAEAQEGTDTRFRSRVGRFMSAYLTGRGFDIRLVDPETPERTIGDEDQSSWTWEVIPREAGTHSLVVRTVAEGFVDGKRVPLGGGETTATVEVVVTTGDRIKDAMLAITDWLTSLEGMLVALAAAITAFFGVVWAIRRGRSGEGE